MQIRKATREDVPAWFELVNAVKSENLPTLFAMTTPITPSIQRTVPGKAALC
ncbi:MAG: hypothetical protein N2067_01195 [Spirochaetaceae bacterium]|nr:hypothetical protein [Spirochaetaceae bacterium]